jgi:hypothetical protein
MHLRFPVVDGSCHGNYAARKPNSTSNVVTSKSVKVCSVSGTADGNYCMSGRHVATHRRERADTHTYMCIVLSGKESLSEEACMHTIYCMSGPMFTAGHTAICSGDDVVCELPGRLLRLTYACNTAVAVADEDVGHALQTSTCQKRLEGIPCAYRHDVDKVGDPRLMVWACRAVCCVTRKQMRGRTINVGFEDGARGFKST